MVSYDLLSFMLKTEITTRGTISIPFLDLQLDHLFSFAVHIGFGIICRPTNLGIISGLGIICGAVQTCSIQKAGKKSCCLCILGFQVFWRVCWIQNCFFFQFLLSISGEFALLNHYFSVNYASFRYDAHTVLTNSQLCNLQVLKMKYSTEKRSCQLAPETDVFKFY